MNTPPPFDLTPSSGMSKEALKRNSKGCERLKAIATMR